MEGGGEGGEGGAFPPVRCQSVSIKGVTVREKSHFAAIIVMDLDKNHHK